jgi:hypothetical protein
VARVLRPGGRFVLVDSTVPAGDVGAFFNRFELARDPSHVRSLTVEEWQALIDAAGLRLEAAESFTKRHDFNDWTGRSGMSDADRDHLARMMLDADDAIRRQFAVEVIDGRLAGFTDTKTLFVATRPAQRTFLRSPASDVSSPVPAPFRGATFSNGIDRNASLAIRAPGRFRC